MRNDIATRMRIADDVASQFGAKIKLKMTKIGTKFARLEVCHVFVGHVPGYLFLPYLFIPNVDHFVMGLTRSTIADRRIQKLLL